MKREKSKPEFEDDGRVIADMRDVERPNLLIPRLPNKRPSGQGKTAPSGGDFSREERKAAATGALAAALLIALVFIAAGAILIFALQLGWNL
ncbi:MAG: hypothetical protein IJJ67_05320 [Oscillospiraceae bacterium]|nr:hypothetical protein [Oscillospiraceae bacterium]